MTYSPANKLTPEQHRLNIALTDAITSLGIDDDTTRDAYRALYLSGAITMDRHLERAAIYGYTRDEWCLEHMEPWCQHCLDVGRYTCHHSDHEDGCIADEPKGWWR